MLNVTKSIALAAPMALRIFREHLFLITAFVVVSSLFCLLVETIFSTGASDFGPVALQMAIATSQLLTDVAFILLLAWLLLNTLKPPISFSVFLDQKLRPLVAESLRSITWILLWSLLLIVPGSYKYTLYIFVSFIVFFDEDYEAGKLDALEFSASLTKLSFIKVFLVMFVTGMISFALEVGPRALGVVGHTSDLFFSILGYLFSGFCFILFYQIYKSLKLQLNWKE